MIKLSVSQFCCSILLSIGALVFTSYTSVDDPFGLLIKRFENYNQSHPQEKVHLHLDKPYYAAGDNIWFKAYLTNSLTSGPSTISGILNVELLDQKDSLIQQMKLPVISGVSWGNISLSNRYKEGNYRIRAYTSWMKNAGQDFYFDKTIKIGNSWSNTVFTTANYTIDKLGEKHNIISTITLTDKQGMPFTDRNVKYEVLFNGKIEKKGKAISNGQGKVTFSFLNTEPEKFKEARILITFSLPNKQVVTREILYNKIAEKTDVQFFPEGGTFIQGIPNRIAIKSIDASGLGKDIKGSIVDNNGAVITAFSTRHLGMGMVKFTPEAGKRYTANFKTQSGAEQSIPFPHSIKSGYHLSVDQTEENVIVNVFTTQDFLNKGNLKLVVQHNGNILFTSKAPDSKQQITAAFQKKQFPAGIVQITLFSPDNLPVCERLIFIKNDRNRIQTKVTADKKLYALRGPIALDLAADINGKPVQGTFSVAVTNTSAIKPDSLNESNIFTSLLLTSDLTGYVEKPNYYFLSNDEKTTEDLDNLMLTQGWRRFSWTNIINNTTAKIQYPPEKTLQISGIILTRGGKPLPRSRVTLINSSGGGLSIDTLTDAEGRFNFDNLSFSDSTKFIVQAFTEKNKNNLEIKLDTARAQVISKNKNTGDLEINVNETIASYLKQSENFFDQMVRLGMLQKGTLLDEVNIVTKKNPAKYSSNLNGPGNANLLIVADQLQTCQTISQCLERGILAGLVVKDGLPYLTRMGNSSPMQLILDGINIDSATFLNINPADIQTVEVLKDLSKTAVYGRRASESGVLILTTKRAGDENFVARNSKGMIAASPKGYSLIKEFYIPAYETQVVAESDDHRSTVYWNPNIITTEKGTASVKYFNANEPGLYRVVVEGFDLQGNLSHATYEYQVK
jgi:hypothetical protein